MKRDVDKFHLMKVFQTVAVNGSFTKGAKLLGMTVSSVSKAVQQLENSLQTKLLYRTTRSQSLTDSGQKYLLYAQRILGDLKEVEEQLLQQGDEPSGTLKVTAPTSIGQFLIAPHMHNFMQAYPLVTVDLILSDKVTDVTEEGFDVAIRSVNAPVNSPLYSKKLGSHSRKLVASPDYLAKIIMPEIPEQLNGLNLLNYTGTRAFAQWSFVKRQSTRIVEPRPVYNSNNYYALYQAVRNGAGIANLYQYLVDEDIKSGRLVHLLPDWAQQERQLFAIYQQRRQASPKIDVFLEFVAGLMH